MNSIRARLLIWSVGALLPVLLASYAFLYVLVERSLWRQFESDMDERVETLVDLAE